MGNIFISYARADDEPFVKQLYQDLTGRGFDIWWDKAKMESCGLTFLQEIRDAIEGSDRLIAVIGPNAVKSEYVRVEWEHALLFSKGVVPILRGGLLSQDIIDYNLVPPELSKFHCPDFRKERSYQDALAELVRVLSEPIPPLGAYRTAVPSLPPHFLPRIDELTLLGNAVLADIKRPEVVNSAKQKTVIVGMGGMGKSVLAAAFARSTETRRAFTDGIAWISIGQDPDMLSNLRQLGRAFDDKMENYVDLKTATDKLPGVLADKVCLIVLDDIWNVDHAQPFINALGPRCRLLITTRDGGIASALEGNEHRLGVLTDAAALQFLANWCGKEVGSLPPEAVSVAKECGNLPFALALCGAMARDGTAWPDMLDALKEADLTFIEKKFPNYPYTDVLKSLKISVDALANEDPEAVKHYQKLVVFHSHKKIPEAAIITLWMHTDGLKERNARKLLTTLNNKALLMLEGESPHRLVTLHDLQHDYLRAFEGDLKKLHVELLEAYLEKCKDGWPGGPNDGYFFEHLAYHLVEAGRKDELRKLLFDFGWIHAKLEAYDANLLLRDYDFLPDDRNLRLVRGAIRLSAHILSKDKKQLRSQLYGRLIHEEAPEIKGMLEQIIRQKDGLWLRTIAQSLTSPREPLLLNLEGHTGMVRSVFVTPDGKVAISITTDYELKVWDIECGKVLKTLECMKYRYNFHCMPNVYNLWNIKAMLPDVRRAISVSSDMTLILWDIESGEVLKTLKGHTEAVNAILVLSNNKRVISVSSDNTLRMWDIDKGTELKTFVGHTEAVNAVLELPDGRHIISASSDMTLKVWDIESGETLKTLKGHTGAVNAVSMFSDGKRVISASSDMTLKVWDIENGMELKTFVGHTKAINAVWVLPDGKRVISRSSDMTIKMWDMEKGEALKTLEGRDNWAGVLVLPDGKRAISYPGRRPFSEKTLIVWDLDSGKGLKTLIGHTEAVNAVWVLPDGKRVISASDDRTLKVWDIESGKEEKEREYHTNRVIAVLMLPDGKRAISASLDNKLKIWDIESGEMLKTLEDHRDVVFDISMLPDGKRIISASHDGTLKLWDVDSGKLLKTLIGNYGGLNAVAVLPDGKHAISAIWSKLILWDIDNEKEQKTIEFDTQGSFNAISVLPDGKRAIAASDDETVKVWDLENGEVLTLVGHTDRVVAISMLPDNKRAISASDDGTLIIWDIECGEILRTLEDHSKAVIAVSVLPDGKRVISGSFDGTLKVWDIESGKVMRTLIGHTSWINSISLLRDGKRVISASWDHTLKIWDIDSGKIIVGFTGNSIITFCAASPDGKTIIAGEGSGRVHILRMEGIE